MKFPIRFGKLNKWHFCILATIGTKIIDSFIIGISPIGNSDEQNKSKLYLFGYGSGPIFNNHPFIKASYCFFGVFILGFVIYIIKKIKRKKMYKEDGFYGTERIPRSDSENFLVIKEYHRGSLIGSIFVILIFIFGFLIMYVYDNYGLVELKFWPLLYLFMYFFSKKILNKALYKHQKLALILILVFCNIGCLTTSLIPDECEKDEPNCFTFKKNSYGKILNTLSWIFIPIIIILYLVSMAVYSYSLIKLKYYIDLRFLEIHIILMIFGILGLFISVALLIISNFISCDFKHFCKCKSENGNKFYFDSFYIYFKSINKDNICRESLTVFILLVVNSLQCLFTLLIIKKLDPFYVMPIDSFFYIICYTIKFFLPKLNSAILLIIKYPIIFFINIFAIICSLIYMEIIILNFNDYEKDIRENIIDRERIDIEEANEERESTSKIEIEIGDNYVVEV